MLDSDLAELYEVENQVLNRAVKRNLKRLPADFMFQLDSDEATGLNFKLAPQRPQAASATGPMIHRTWSGDAVWILSYLIFVSMPPVDRNLAEIEGWIWTRDPTL